MKCTEYNINVTHKYMYMLCICSVFVRHVNLTYYNVSRNLSSCLISFTSRLCCNLLVTVRAFTKRHQTTDNFIVAFSEKSSFETVAKFFNIIGLYIYIQELRAKTNRIKESYNSCRAVFLLNADITTNIHLFRSELYRFV
jgi:hypothetical protein